ncbi:hypothetical protein [Trichocoleus sp. FACHB-262]|uniref:hypothetical protein n=1 Tax=Trichocoleus sp. FACHB-262 TaxID=2692869 RepID=UPI001687329A|nr:hypothetical protein [Trichocoleus sp. FACHB-262]MBD2120807.1 hypothetical protein [Trichocoleus sp. FACHB-262]
MKKWAISTSVILTSLLLNTHVQAGTAAYFARCSFLDRGTNNGGNVSNMPCYAVEGGNMYSVFFHIAWKDGIKTQLNAKSTSPLKDAITGRAYKRVGRYTFVAEKDGDVITLDNVQYTSERYRVNDPTLMRLLK